MPNPPEATRHHNSRKLSTLQPLRAIQNHSFSNETPCIGSISNASIRYAIVIHPGRIQSSQRRYLGILWHSHPFLFGVTREVPANDIYFRLLLHYSDIILSSLEVTYKKVVKGFVATTYCADKKNTFFGQNQIKHAFLNKELVFQA